MATSDKPPVMNRAMLVGIVALAAITMGLTAWQGSWLMFGVATIGFVCGVAALVLLSLKR